MNKRPRILFIAFPFSIHSVRWISQLNDTGWDVYLFASQRSPLHEQFTKIIYFSSTLLRHKGIDRSVKWVGWTSFAFYLDFFFTKLLKINTDQYFQKLALFIVIRTLHPDIIHSLELQHAGYLTASVKKRYSKNFPKNIASIWGSDLYLFGRLQSHKEKIRETLVMIDFLISESPRDDQLAIGLGYKNTVLPNFQSTGGFNFSNLSFRNEFIQPSKRKIIVLKGYEHWAGRALFGLAALKKCSEYLKDYELVIHSATPDVVIAAELFSQETLIKTTIVDQTSHVKILQLYGVTRIYIGLSISDGVPNSMLEAMAMGAFPIQSNTAYTDSWIVNGETGIIVPPDEPEIIALAIKKVLVNDKLVDAAAKVNVNLIRNRLDAAQIKNQVLSIYKGIIY